MKMTILAPAITLALLTLFAIRYGIREKKTALLTTGFIARAINDELDAGYNKSMLVFLGWFVVSLGLGVILPAYSDLVIGSYIKEVWQAQ